MVRSEAGVTVGEEEVGGVIWGTWEELLLACAVCRHGTARWDSVSMELGGRCSSPHLLTPERCRQRYRELRRRFEQTEDGEGGRGGTGDDEGETEMRGGTAVVPWLEELRRLRLDELRREVERSDASIG